MTTTEPTTDETTVESPPTEDVAIDAATLDKAAAALVPLSTEQIAPLLEALLFVADGPVEESALARALGLTRRQIEAPLAALGATLRERGVRLQRGPEGAQLVTAPAAATYIEQFLGLEAARRLSLAAIETLAIIAYRQPVTRGTLEAIRGVSCDGPIDTLRARGLIDVAGRADSPGRPTLFATTQKFLDHFGLERAEDLPELPPEVAELAAALPERAEQIALDTLVPPGSEQDAGVAGLDARQSAGTAELVGVAAPVVNRSEYDDPEPNTTCRSVQRPALPAWLGGPAALPGAVIGSFVPPSATRAVLPPGNAGPSFGG